MLEPMAWRAPQQVPEPSTPDRSREVALTEEVLRQLDDNGSANVSRAVTNLDRAMGAGLAGALAQRAAQVRATNRTEGTTAALWPKPDAITLELSGSAGQGLAAFAVPGMRIVLRGEANDSVAKSMAGGTLIVRPAPEAQFDPAQNAIIGNGALYGATGGSVWIYGRAGDRFAVRNSGARAVVEGTGLHACEYMTGGEVAILGPLAANAGAGMTGGLLFLPRQQQHRINIDSLQAVELDDDGLDRLVGLLRDHAEAPGSATAKQWLAGSDKLREAFVWARPR